MTGVQTCALPIYNIELRSQSGSIHNVDMVVNKIENDPGGMVAIITIIDRTKERELENMKLDFVSMAAHELRTPMTSIRGYLSLVEKDPTLETASNEVRRYINRALNSSLQLVGLINNLLSVSRIERGAFETNVEKCDWARSIIEAVTDQQIAAQQRNIRLRYDGPPENALVIVDDLAMREVLNNLISNAMRYTPAGGEINVLLRESGDEWVTTVMDHGEGISKEAQSNLFTKFYRVHGGLASGSGGTGLGLFISKERVSLHGGRIWVESEPGKGAAFSFTLKKFDDKKYQEVLNLKPVNIRKKRGWTTKNTTS